MKIIVPMAGTGQRFVQEGYTRPKPLIKLSCDGRMIIEHVLDMFDKDHDQFVFICNQTHYHETDMAEVVSKLVGHSSVIAMPTHKLGPVWTVSAAFHEVEDDEEVIVSYCDGTLKWNKEDFLDHVHQNNLDGCLLTHTGFHPHTLSSTKMAFIKESDGLVQEVKEKSSYTDNPMTEHASSGVYYFRTGAIMKKYFKALMDLQLHFNGEFYVTLVYNLLIQDGLRVGYYDTDFVAILGTPEDVRNFEAWSTIARHPNFRHLNDLEKCKLYWTAYWSGPSS